MLRHILFPLFIMVLAACEAPPAQIELHGDTMGTTYNITVINDDGALQKDALSEVIETTLVDVNAHYSNWDPDSEISRFNAQQTTDPVPTSIGLIEMMQLTRQIHTTTNGKFDLTLEPVINLWGFGPNGTVTQEPDTDALGAAMEKTGLNRTIRIDPVRNEIQKLEPDTTIMLAPIAKGYGIDAVADALIDQGATNFMVEIGGDLYAKGQSPSNADWRIGIERPDAGLRAVQEIVELTNMGMATSGDYRIYFEQDGVRYSHIIDPATGRPITHRTASVTVLAESATEADAWATALLVVGAETGLQICEELDIAALFIVRQDPNTHIEFALKPSPAFKRLQKATAD